jgi:hypothetical protein
MGSAVAYSLGWVAGWRRGAGEEARRWAARAPLTKHLSLGCLVVVVVVVVVVQGGIFVVQCGRANQTR